MVLWLRNFIVSLAVFSILGAVFVFFPLIKETRAGSLPTSVTVTLCGNGVTDGVETCDDGASNGQYSSSAAGKHCNSTCNGWAAYCGDSTTQAAYGEECDDGNNTADDGCSATCQTEAAEATPPPSGGGGGGGGAPPETKVVLRGKAYPNTDITVLKDGQVAITIRSDFQANFEATLSSLTAGTYTFSVWARDAKGRKSITFSFTVNVSLGVITTISGIFIPPTIELEDIGVQKGETLDILGQTAPTSVVTVRINSPTTLTKQTVANYKGEWDYALDTSLLEKGSHFVSAKAVYGDDFTSSYSNVLAFYVGQELAPGASVKIKSAELNKDNKINIIDFSILLYNWGKPKNTQADLNDDGRVNLVDFSILMYQWTG